MYLITHVLFIICLYSFKVNLVCSFAGDTLSDCIKGVRRPNCIGKTSSRTLDGTCNNLFHRTWGAALTPLRRLVPAVYHDKDGIDTPLGFPGISAPIVPTPLEVSARLFHVVEEDSGNTGLVSILHTIFGQFLAHDITLSTNSGGCAKPTCQPGSRVNFKYPCFPIRFSRLSDKGCLPFTRSQALCQKSHIRTVRQQVNVLSAYIDASHIYGVKIETLTQLRTNDGTGRLKVSNNNLLPFDPAPTGPCATRGGCFIAGDVRVNEHIGLAGLHTIFLREHNRIATELKQLFSSWSGEKIFQTTRKIIGGIFQHIVYNEYLPILSNLRRYKGYKRNADPSIINGFSNAAFRYGHTQLKNAWGQLDNNFNQVGSDIPLRQTFFNISVYLKSGIENTMFGLIGNQSEESDRNFASGIGKNLFIPPGQSGTGNLMAINMQRGRDHGLPGYNVYREACGLGKRRKWRKWGKLVKRAASFSDFKQDLSQTVLDILQELYGQADNHIDLFAAGISEKLVKGKVLGRTFGCIVRNQFERIRDGDRFFYRRRGVFTKKQLREIEKVTMAKVMCNTLNGIVSLQTDVFRVFKEGTKRHECSRLPAIDLTAWSE